MSEMLTNLSSSVSGIWQGMSLGKRIFATGIVVTPFLVLAFMLARPTNYLPLFTNMQASDVGQVVAVLKEQNVPYRLAESGSAILVPADTVYETRVQLASQGLPQGGVIGFELFDSNPLGLTDFDQRVRYTRALQGELTRSIMGLREVQSARVHIVLPEKSLFVKDERPASASVILQFRPGSMLSSSQVSGIVNLVASSVAGLAPKDVTVLDNYGNILSKPVYQDDIEGLDSDSVMRRLDIQRRFEQEQEDKISTMLERVLGIGKSVVTVSARLNFDYLEERASLVSPQGEGTIVDEETTTESYKGAQGGAAGVDANIPGYESDNSSGESSYEKETQSRSYEIGKKETYRIVAPGLVEQLSVAVWLDGEADGEMSTRVTDAVTSAIGLNSAQGDAITVNFLKFSGGDVANMALDGQGDLVSTPAGGSGVPYIPIGIGLLVVLVAGALFGRSRKNPDKAQVGARVDLMVGETAATVDIDNEPIPVAQLTPEQREKRHIQKEVSRLVSENPEEVAKLVKMWMLED